MKIRLGVFRVDRIIGPSMEGNNFSLTLPTNLISLRKTHEMRPRSKTSLNRNISGKGGGFRIDTFWRV